MRRSVLFPFYVRKKTELDVVLIKALFFIRVCRQVSSVFCLCEKCEVYLLENITRQLASHAASRGYDV